MKFGSLFAGIGGFDLGLERAGMECAWQVEIDPFCQKVLAKHWPDVERYSDVRECGKHNLSAVDLICGGFPCQPFSVAGKQRGADDDRNLWPEMLRVIEECRPRWIVCENTPGIFGLYLDTVLADLEGAGYEAWTIDIPAAAIGAWHRRNRIWIVAHAQHDKILHNEFNQESNAISDWFGSDVENTNSGGLPESEFCQEQPRRAQIVGGGEDVPYPVQYGRQSRRTYNATQSTQRRQPDRGCQRASVSQSNNDKGQQADGTPGRMGRIVVADNDCGLAGGGAYWATEPELGRVAYGIPHRVDRLRALGNAVVPQVVELIGRAIMANDE